MYIASLRSSPNYKEQPYQYASPSKQILKSKAKPYPPCTNCGFNDHLPDDCRNYPKYKICGSYDHFTSEDIRIIQIRVCTQPLTIMILSTLKERYIREPILYLDSGCSSSMTGVKSYLHKYVEQPGPKVVFGDNSSCITEGYGSINCGGIVFSKRKTGFGIVTSWRKEDLIREIDLYMPIYQCRLHIYLEHRTPEKNIAKVSTKSCHGDDLPSTSLLNDKKGDGGKKLELLLVATPFMPTST
ncbi:hypothetical protein Tco_1344293 [Tanacetum coccineum]